MTNFRVETQTATSCINWIDTKRQLGWTEDMKTRLLILTLLALTFLLASPAPRTALATGGNQDYSAELISPRAGEVLRSGQVVTITWASTFPSSVDVSMCETELMVSLDGGWTYSYISSQRNPKIKSYNWTVPAVPAGTTVPAILDIRFGCLGIYAETSSRQTGSTFWIRGK